jgi:hypothetical protein
LSHPKSKGTTFILLEGASDIRLFRKLFNLSCCKVENIPGGKFKLEECVGELVKVHPLLIGIRDADFIHLEKAPYNKANLFLTDFHDMEMMLVSTDEIFSALVFEFTDLPKENHLEVRNKIFTTIEMVGYFKWLNEREGLEFNVEASFIDLISFVNLEINFSQYFSRVLHKSPNAKVSDESVVLQKINALKGEKVNYFHLCNGHDFMKALAEYIRAMGNSRTASHDSICSALRMAFTFDHFKQSKLFESTRLWAESKKSILY